MSRSKKQNRSLSFEHLEAKSSLTALVGWIDSAPTVVTASQESGLAVRFLQYVASLEEVSIERTAPDAAETLIADQWLVNESPSRDPS